MKLMVFLIENNKYTSIKLSCKSFDEYPADYYPNNTYVPI